MAKKTEKAHKNLMDIAAEVGLAMIPCPCGEKIEGQKALEAFFARIVSECRKGQKVRIKNFGVFEAKKYKGRKLHSPVLEDGEVEFDDSLVLRFHQSVGAKRALNDRKDEDE